MILSYAGDHEDLAVTPDGANKMLAGAATAAQGSLAVVTPPDLWLPDPSPTPTPGSAGGGSPAVVAPQAANQDMSAAAAASPLRAVAAAEVPPRAEVALAPAASSSAAPTSAASPPPPPPTAPAELSPTNVAAADPAAGSPAPMKAEAATEVTASLVAAAAPAAEAAEGSEDVHLFSGAQKRASSVAFEVLLPAQQLIAVLPSAVGSMFVQHACVMSPGVLLLGSCVAPNTMLAVKIV